MSEFETDLDEIAIPTALFDVTLELVQADPLIGIFHPYIGADARITSWKIGELVLDREQLKIAIGPAELAKLEERLSLQAEERANEGSLP